MNNSIVKQTWCFLAIAFFCCGCQVLISQNLVSNPSFEDYVQCPEDYGTFQDDVLFFTKPTTGSTDYFNDCSEIMGTRSNFAGRQKAFDGKGYAGFYAFGPKDYREYIGGELTTKLEKGKTYIVSIMVSLADKSAFGIYDLGFLLGSKPINLQTTRSIPHSITSRDGGVNFIKLTHRQHLSNKEEWVEIKNEYIATGKERYFTLGNFRENRKTRLVDTGKNLKKAAYYYVDMISITEAEKLFTLDEIYVLKDLNFDVNGFKVEGQVREKFIALAAHLKEHPSLNIVVYGHTDNVGDKAYNLELSDKRAKAVSMFLVDNGLSPFRIAWKGYGDAKPLAGNKTKSGRKTNRRVEFLVSEKKREYYASGVFEDDDN